MSYGGDNRGPTLNAVNWSLTAPAIITVLLRLVSRAYLTRQHDASDLLILLAMLVQVAYVAVQSAMVSVGYGRHISTLPAASVVRTRYLNMVSNWIFPFTFVLPKLAIVALMSRLLSLRRPARLIFWSLNTLLLASCVVLAIIWFVQCSPPAHYWDRVNVPGTCWSPDIITNYSLFVAVFSALLDLLFAVYPPFVIAKLNMPTYRKAVISLSLGGGVIAAAVVVYKTVLLSRMSEIIAKDQPWGGAPILIWTTIEGNLLIMMACLPTLGPVVRFVKSEILALYSRVSEPKWRNGQSAEVRRTTRKSRSAMRGTQAVPCGMTMVSLHQDDLNLLDVERHGSSNSGALSQTSSNPRAASALPSGESHM